MGNGPMKIKKRFPWGWVVLLGLGAVALIFTWLQKNAPVQLALTRPTLMKAGERNPLHSASGYIVARHRATLSAKVPGRIAWLGVEEGTRVTKGQVIARLEAIDLQAGRDQTEANLQQAELDLTRAEALVKDGVLDRASLDKLRSASTVLKAQLRYQDALMENMILRAPFSGTVTQKLTEVGETVSPGSAGGANAINAIATLADFESLEVETEVSESGIAKLKKGMPTEIRVDALENDPQGRVLKGLLREIYPTSNRQKAVVIVRVAFKERHPLLVPDMGAKVTFLGDPYLQDVLILGREQVVKNKGVTSVWVLQEGKAQLKAVKILSENPLGYEVQGISAEEPLLMIPADFKLQEGTRIKVKER
ncbi:MAG: efflux RND transporter periplasmic adaptor subunit [Holophaga sp.]|nr:efflux RND transporter periplasmic adaptor subunit [Holophaga sp.]